MVPTLLGDGEVDGWCYLVSRLRPGVALERVWGGLDGVARARILRALGELLGGLHRAPTAGFGGAHADWDGFVAAESVACLARHRRWGLAPALVDGIEGLLASVDLLDARRVPST